MSKGAKALCIFATYGPLRKNLCKSNAFKISAMKRIVYLSTICCILLLSCKKDSQTENQLDIPQVIYEMTTTERSTILGRTGSGHSGLSATNDVAISNIVWTGGYANVDEIKFQAKGDNDEVEYKSKVDRTIDMFNAVALLGSIAVPPGEYKKIEFKIKFAPQNQQAAFEINGSYLNDAGVVVPITFAVNQPFEIKFELKSRTVIDFNTDYAALNELALSLLTNGVSASAIRNAVRDANGRIFISANKNQGLFKVMWDNFKVMLKVKMKKK